MFFSELMKEATDVAGCFSSRVRRLLHLHIASGMQRYVARLCQCFKNDQEVMVQEGRVLIEYVIMNALAIRKILKKYDKVILNWFCISEFSCQSNSVLLYRILYHIIS